MALRKPLFLNNDGIFEECTATDSFQLGGLEMSGNVVMGSNKITGLGNGTDSTDAVNKSQLDALVPSVVFTAGVGGVAAGDPVYISAVDTVSKGDSSVDSKSFIVGIAESAIAESATGEVVGDGLLEGVLTGATAGTRYFLANGGGLTPSVPGSNNRVIQIGFAKNATDLLVAIRDFGKKI